MLARGDYYDDEEDFDGDGGGHGEDESDAGDDDHIIIGQKSRFSTSKTSRVSIKSSESNAIKMVVCP